MFKIGGAFVLLVCSSGATAATGTDFGVRHVPSESRKGTVVPVRIESAVSSKTGARNLRDAVAITAKMGRVTSTYRSPAHNRYVGGTRNSFHLSGRAIDVVPRSGFRHRDIEAALVTAGYRLTESLNEGDHSHFAFDFNAAPRMGRARAPMSTSSSTPWKVVYPPSSRSR